MIPSNPPTTASRSSDPSAVTPLVESDVESARAVGTADPRIDSAARRSRIARRTRRVRIGLSAAIVLVLMVLGISAVVAGVRSAAGTGGTSIPLEKTRTSSGAGSGPEPSEPGEADRAEETLYVHVLGAVASPGLYTLASDARVVDAIAAAGGFAPDADAGSVNLARTLTDGEQIIVTKPGEAPPSGGVEGTGPPGEGTAGGPVNLNSATAAELKTLPRIGPALAERIVTWRTENGRFRLIDELLSVPGIGDAILAGLDGLVTL